MESQIVLAASGEDLAQAIEAFLRTYEFREPDPILASVLSLAKPKSALSFRRIETLTSYGSYPVSCLLHPGRRSLTMIFPGITASQYSDESQARAEYFFEHGQNVCVFSNSFRIDFYYKYKVVPGDLKREGDLFWQATRSLLLQLAPITKKVHFVSMSYGTHILKEVLILAHHEWKFLQKHSFGRIELASSIFLSPPYQLTASIEALDRLWNEKFPALLGLGTLPLTEMSFELLDFAFKARPLSKDFRVEAFQALILRMGFYQGMQETAKYVAEDSGLNTSTKDPDFLNLDWNFDFRDYLKFVYNKLSDGPLYSPVFTHDWEKISSPVMIVYAEDDYINAPRDICTFSEIQSSKKNAFLVKLPRGSHLGFLSDLRLLELLSTFLTY
jgi:pimeloyl-ACP methyl ester carboxylesterase